MHVDLDAFYASVEQLRRPELRGKPVIVGGAGVEGERGVVAAASYEARPFGVRSAMPLGRARRLCPNAVFVPCDFPAYREASKSVFAILDRYSPVIEPIALDEAYLDLTGEEALLGPPDTVAHRLRDEVKTRCGLDLSIGVASCKLVAKVASELRKPRGLVVVAPGGAAAGCPAATWSRGRLRSPASRAPSSWSRRAARRRSSPPCRSRNSRAAGRPRRSGWNESAFAPSATWPPFRTRSWANSSATTAGSSVPTPGASIRARSCRPAIRKASRGRSPLTVTCATPARSAQPRSASCRTWPTASGRTGYRLVRSCCRDATRPFRRFAGRRARPFPAAA